MTDPGSGSDGTYNSGGGGSDRRLWILNTIVRNLLCLSRQFILKYNEIKYTGYRQAYRKGTPDAYKTEAEINAQQPTKRKRNHEISEESRPHEQTHLT